MRVFKMVHNGRKVWCLDARREGLGRRFFPSKEKALEEQSQLETESRKDGEEWRKLSDLDRMDLLYVFSEASKVGVSVRSVWEVYKATKGGSIAAKKLLREVIEETLQSKRAAGRREDYVDGLGQYLNAFARGRDGRQITEFGVKEIEDWFAARKEAPATRRSNLGRLSAMFDLAWRRNYIPENPCWRIESVSIEKEAPSILSVDQCEKALRFTVKHQPRFLAWLVLTLFVGLRPEAEADVITWEQIDLQRQRIRIAGAGTKVRTHRIIELSLCPIAIEWLTMAQKLKSPLQLRIGTRKKLLRKLRDHLGFKKWPQDILRHTAASNLLAHHQDAGKVASFLGNSAGTLLRDYKALVTREDAEKFLSLRPKQVVKTE